MYVLECIFWSFKHNFVGNQQDTSSLLIYSTTADIRITPTDKVQQIILMNVSENTMIDFHYELQKLCWCDHNDETLQCTDFDGNKTGEKVILVIHLMLDLIHTFIVEYYYT